MSRPRKPTKLKILHGQTRPDRQNHNPEPKPENCQPPETLSDAAKAEWHALAPEMAKLGLLSRLDVPAFAELCSWIVISHQAKATLDELGIIIKSPTGAPQQHPALAVLATASKHIKVLGDALGLTPAGRSRLNTPNEPEAESDFEQFLNAKGRTA